MPTQTQPKPLGLKHSKALLRPVADGTVTQTAPCPKAPGKVRYSGSASAWAAGTSTSTFAPRLSTAMSTRSASDGEAAALLIAVAPRAAAVLLPAANHDAAVLPGAERAARAASWAVVATAAGSRDARRLRHGACATKSHGIEDCILCKQEGLTHQTCR